MTFESTVYNVMHPWHWLTYGQNSSALATLATVAAAVAASIAGLFAVRTYRAAVEQLRVANSQAQLGTKQFLEAVRPQLTIAEIVEGDTEQSMFEVIVRNIGSGRAMNIKATGGPSLTRDSLPALASFKMLIAITKPHMLGPGAITFFLRYSSVDGRRFRTEVTARAPKYMELSGVPRVTISEGQVQYESIVELDGGGEPPSYEDRLCFRDSFSGEPERVSYEELYGRHAEQTLKDKKHTLNYQVVVEDGSTVIRGPQP